MPSTVKAPPVKVPSSTMALFPIVPASTWGFATVSRLSWSDVQVKEASSGPKAATRTRLAALTISESLKLHSAMRAALGETPPAGSPAAKHSKPKSRPGP